MANGYGLTHLSKHRGDKAEARVREELRRVKGGKKARCGWSMGQRRICGKIDIVMIASLFKKIEQILTWNVFENEQEECRRFQRAMQRDNVRMLRNRLVDGCLLEEMANGENFRARKGGDITNTLPP